MTTKLADLMRAADPASGLVAAPITTQDERIEAILAADPSTPRFEGTLVSPNRRRLPFVVIVSVVLALAVAVTAEGTGRAPWLSPDPARRADQILARAAEFASDPVLQPGQYHVQRQQGTYLAPPEDGSGGRYPDGGLIMNRDRTVYVGPGVGSYRCEVLVHSEFGIGTYGEPPYGRERIGGDGASCYRLADHYEKRWNSIPRDPQGLAELIEIWGSPHGEFDPIWAFDGILTVLSATDVPADLRAALYTHLIDLEGVEVIQSGVDVQGRSGTALGIASPDAAYQQSLIIDPRTGELLGFGAGTEIGLVDHVIALHSDVVDALPPDVIEAACEFAADWPEPTPDYQCEAPVCPQP